MTRPAESLAGRRVLITGAARGIGAATARRLHARGARVALAGLEPGALEGVAADCGGAPWFGCDVADRAQVDRTVAAAVERLGGLDVVIANAGVAAQLPLVGGDPAIFERTLAVNVLGVYYTLRAAAPHISPSPRLRAGGRLPGRRGAPAAARGVQRLQGGASRRWATRCGSSCAPRAPASGSPTSPRSTRT